MIKEQPILVSMYLKMKLRPSAAEQCEDGLVFDLKYYLLSSKENILVPKSEPDRQLFREFREIYQQEDKVHTSLRPGMKDIERRIRESESTQTAMSIPIELFDPPPTANWFPTAPVSTKCNFLYMGSIWTSNIRFSADQLLAAIATRIQRAERKSPTRNTECEQKQDRHISQSVRIDVWRRDGGKCVRCGSRKRLEYDHIIPVAEGGGSTSRNVELLCEVCNRTKSSRVEG